MFFKMEHCDVYYGQIQALYDINVEINPGEIIKKQIPVHHYGG